MPTASRARRSMKQVLFRPGQPAASPALGKLLNWRFWPKAAGIIYVYIGSVRPRALSLDAVFCTLLGQIPIVRKRQYYGDNNEIVELSVLR